MKSPFSGIPTAASARASGAVRFDRTKLARCSLHGGALLPAAVDAGCSLLGSDNQPPRRRRNRSAPNPIVRGGDVVASASRPVRASAEHQGRRSLVARKRACRGSSARRLLGTTVERFVDNPVDFRVARRLRESAVTVLEASRSGRRGRRRVGRSVRHGAVRRGRRVRPRLRRSARRWAARGGSRPRDRPAHVAPPSLRR